MVWRQGPTFYGLICLVYLAIKELTDIRTLCPNLNSFELMKINSYTPNIMIYIL